MALQTWTRLVGFYSASSLQQQSPGRHAAPLWHIILIPWPAVFALTIKCLEEKQQIPYKFIVFSLTDRGSNQQFTTFKKGMLTITPQMPFYMENVVFFKSKYFLIGWFGWFMPFNATFNNISTLSWRLVLLVEETGKNHCRPVTSHWQTLLHNVLSSTPHHERGSNSQF